jgi:uncharacterized protein YndB with AHSA1/START domain
VQDKITVSGRIAKPVEDVYEAVADPVRLSKYFTTGGAKGRLETGKTVTWDFADFPGAFPVEVVEATPHERIVIHWGSDDPKDEIGKTTVTFTFESLEDGRTLVTITEEGWKGTAAGEKQSYGNLGGWMQMLCAMKAWLEHGINLREGMFK